MDDIFDDQHEENDDVPLMAKLDIEEILRNAGRRSEIRESFANEADIEKANFEWASQFAGNYLMMRHIIDEKIRRGDVPEYRKRKKFVVREFKLFRNI